MPRSRKNSTPAIGPADHAGVVQRLRRSAGSSTVWVVAANSSSSRSTGRQRQRRRQARAGQPGRPPRGRRASRAFHQSCSWRRWASRLGATARAYQGSPPRRRRTPHELGQHQVGGAQVRMRWCMISTRKLQQTAGTRAAPARHRGGYPWRTAGRPAVSGPGRGRPPSRRRRPGRPRPTAAPPRRRPGPPRLARPRFGHRAGAAPRAVVQSRWRGPQDRGSQPAGETQHGRRCRPARSSAERCQVQIRRIVGASSASAAARTPTVRSRTLPSRR